MVLATPVHADVADLTIQTNCSNLPSYNGVVQPAAGTYDVYARLGRRGDEAQVKGYAQILGQTDCLSYDRVDARGDSWTRLGIFVTDGAEPYVFQLSSDSLAALPSANRPAIMLVPHDNPPCVPTTECVVQVDGQTGYVRPPGTLLNQDSLHVVQVADPATDQLDHVNYYVDNQLEYTLPTLKTFDWKYLSNDQQAATAIAYYASGQEVVIPQTPPSNLSFDNPLNVLHLFVTSAWWLRLLMIFGILLLLIWIGFRLLAHIHQKREWEDVHGLTAYEESQWTDRQWRLVRLREHLLHTAEKYARLAVLPLIAIVIIVVLVIGNNSVVTLYAIDGQSMESTYHNHHLVLLDKWPITWARLNHKVFAPKRGQVVVVRAVFGDTTATVANDVNLFLIKRVVGLPGDHVVINNGHITIYNNAHPTGFDFDAGQPWAKTMHHNLPNEHLDLQLSQDEIFVSGDNRPESIDSRFNGPIHINNVIGVVSGKLF